MIEIDVFDDTVRRLKLTSLDNPRTVLVVVSSRYDLHDDVVDVTSSLSALDVVETKSLSLSSSATTGRLSRR